MAKKITAAQKRKKNNQELIKYQEENRLRICLGMVGIQTDNHTAYLITETLDTMDALGGKFDLKTACQIRCAVDQKFNKEKPSKNPPKPESEPTTKKFNPLSGGLTNRNYTQPNIDTSLENPNILPKKVIEIFQWLLGEVGNFPVKPKEKLLGQFSQEFWWRTHLREKLKAAGVNTNLKK